MENQYYKRKELFQMTPDCFTDWISSQEQIAGRLLGLAAKKRQVLIAGVPGGEELQELNEILQEENEMLIVLREIEKEWQDNNEGRWTALQEPELAARCRSLQADFEKFRMLNRENSALLTSVQQYLNFSLDLLCGDQSSETYRESPANKGEVERIVSHAGKFDCQV